VEENLELKPYKGNLSPEDRQDILKTLHSQLTLFEKTLQTKRTRLESVSRDMKAQAEREVSLLPSVTRRNANIAIISALVLLAVLSANLAGNGGQITSISIFTIVVFIGIMLWMLATYFTSRRDVRVTEIRRQYQQEFEQIAQDTTEEVTKLEKSIELARRQISRLESEVTPEN
jgi:ABC-type multidrug transport system fused ATPase/permease subunit